MFELTYGLEKVGIYESFSKSFIELYKRLNVDLEKGMAWQTLETTIWIVKKGTNHPIMFYEARDKACNIGLLVDGKINPDFKNPEKR